MLVANFVHGSYKYFTRIDTDLKPLKRLKSLFSSFIIAYLFLHNKTLPFHTNNPRQFVKIKKCRENYFEISITTTTTTTETTI